MPFYVGKGSRKRVNDINRNETHRKVVQFLKEREKTPETFIIKENLSEKESLILESKLIDIYGLEIYGGYLTNLDEGYKFSERRNKYKKDYEIVCGKYRTNFLLFKRKGIQE